MNYYEHHLGDYAAATAHLSWDEDMAYQRLIRAYYHHEKPIPADVKAACRLARATTAVQRQAVETVLQEFFELGPDGWRQKRCDAEIERYQEKQEKARRSANARWSAKPTQSEGNANASPNAMRTHSEGNAPRHQTPDTNTPLTPRKRGTVHEFPPGFDRVWSAYPRKVGKDAAAKAFAKRKPDAALVEAMVKAIETQKRSADWTKDGGQFIPHLATWLNGGRWMDEQPSSVDPALADLFRRGQG